MIGSHAKGVLLHLHIQPGASRTEITGRYGDALKIRVQAPPVDGKANKTLLAFLSKLFGIPASRVQLLKGETGRRKTVLINGLDIVTARVVLSQFDPSVSGKS